MVNFCSRCGKPIAIIDAQFCSHCGAPLPLTQNSEPLLEKKEEIKKADGWEEFIGKCPVCGANITDLHLPYCPTCLQSISQSNIIPDNPKTCSQCGFQTLDLGMKKCLKCSTQFPQQKNSEVFQKSNSLNNQKNESPKLPKPGLLGWFAIFIAIIILITFFAGLSSTILESISKTPNNPSITPVPTQTKDTCGYYTTFNPYDGCYCMDKKGYPWGYPPGYNYYVMEDSVSPFKDSPYYDNTAPPRKVKIWYYNHSAWVQFKDWPPCTQYGEW